MIIKQKYRTCVKCGIVGGKFSRLRHKKKNGRYSYYVRSCCSVCEAEDARKRYRKSRKDPEAVERKREKNREYKAKSKSYTKKDQEYYFRNRDIISQKRKLKYKKNRTKILLKCKEYRLRKSKEPKKFDSRKHIWSTMEASRIAEIIVRRSKTNGKNE